jgi:hypothetical protein
MYWQPAPSNAAAIPVNSLSLITIALLVLFIFVFGIFPGLALGLAGG